MKRIPVIAVFDVGKTNKKLFLFDQDYKIVYEKSARFTEIVDEDGFPCENVDALKSVLFESLNEVYKLKDFEVKAINFSTYGASFVYVGEDGNPVSPLYNYLKPYPQELQDAFYKQYGGEAKVARETASPVLGNLNSGMQLYRIKHQNPKLYSKIKHALHLPQYMSYLLTGQAVTDITSIGSHTNLWDFDKNQYHQWVIDENLLEKLAPVVAVDTVFSIRDCGFQIGIGIGLHDSSAALIPYLANFHEPFMLLSTGTWCISLNPFNHSPLTADELSNDCLCYMDYHGNPVKASRLFAGHDHEVQVNRIATHFNENVAKYKTVDYSQDHLTRLKSDSRLLDDNGELISFAKADLASHQSGEESYHHLAFDLVRQQAVSSALVLNDSTVKRIFVDGGFSKNSVYMNMLALAFADMEVFAASMPQATALGTALAMHSQWNTKTLPANLIELNYYAVNQLI
jgi:sugar (pentulose or hexulose) kinase